MIIMVIVPVITMVIIIILMFTILSCKMGHCSNKGHAADGKVPQLLGMKMPGNITVTTPRWNILFRVD